MKNSFVLYTDYLEHIKELSLDQVGTLFLAIMYYQSGQKLPDMDAVTKMAFNFIRYQLDKDNQKYAETSERRREAGRLGGRPRTNGFSEKQTKAKKANGFSEKQTKAKKPDNDNENDNDNDKNIELLRNSCPEPDKSAPVPVIGLPLNTGIEYQVFQSKVDEYKELYPAVDVEQELREMKAWLISNPKRRKTSRGITRFINAWLAREQDKPHPRQGRQSNKFNQFQQTDYDFDRLEREILSN